MSDRSAIEWTDASWNPVRARRTVTVDVADYPDGAEAPVRKVLTGWHCEHASEGCRHCYAERFNRFVGTGLDYKPGHLVPRGEVEIYLDEKMLLLPLKWKRPRRIFVGSMTDLFGDFVTDAMLDRIFAVMALAPQHTFQVLTKRAARMRRYMSDRARMDWLNDEVERIAEAQGLRGNCVCRCDGDDGDIPWPLPNVWLGVSAEDQAAAEERVPDLLAAPAAVRFLSCEPLLGPVDLRTIDVNGGYNEIYPLTGTDCEDDDGNFTGELPKIDWVICGGESGPKARPMHPDWVRSLRDQCAAANVAFFFKQWGEFAPGEIAGDYLDPDKTAKGVSLFDDGWTNAWSYPDSHCDDEPDLYRIGKKRAGRLLDGVEHSVFPVLSGAEGPQVAPR